MIEAVVFDMDGLLVDSEPLWERARIEAFGAERLHWTDADQQAVMGSSTQEWAAYLQQKLDHAYSIEAIIERVIQQMIAFYRESVPLMPGADAALALLGGHYPLGLASGSPYRLIEAALKNTGWDGMFADVLSTDDMANGKPAPDIYLAISRQMGVPVERMAVLEDSTNGILAGLAAGAKVIAVPDGAHRPSEDIVAQATLVLDSLEDLTLATLRAL